MKNLLARLFEENTLGVFRVTLLAALLLKLGSRGPYATGLVAHGLSPWLLVFPAVIALALLARRAERALYPVLWLTIFLLTACFPASEVYELRLHPLLFGLLALWAHSWAGESAELLLGRPWPVLLPQAYLAFVYFEGGWGKLAGNPGAWVGGEALRSYLALRSGLGAPHVPLSLVGSPEACRLLSVAVLVFELGFPVAVLAFPRRLLQPWLLFGLVFQVSAHLLLGIQFLFPYLVCYYLHALDWKRFAFPGRARAAVVAPAAILLLAGDARADDPSARYACLREDEARIYAPKPNCEGIGLNDTSLRSRSNALGLRDRDFPPRPPKGVTRILLLGSSNVFGESTTANMAKFLERALNEGGKPSRFEVINGGVIGYSAVQSALLLPALLEAYHPQVVIYDVALSATLLSTWFLDAGAPASSGGTADSLAGFNLLWPLPRALSDRITDSALRIRLITVSRFVRVYTRLLGFEITRLLRGGENELLATYQRYLRRMRADAERAGARFHVSTTEAPDNFFRQEKASFWLKPEWIAYHLLPAEPVRLPEVEEFWSRLASEHSLIDARREFRDTQAGDSPPPPQTHLNSDGLARQGASLGKVYLKMRGR